MSRTDIPPAFFRLVRQAFFHVSNPAMLRLRFAQHSPGFAYVLFHAAPLVPNNGSVLVSLPEAMRKASALFPLPFALLLSRRGNGQAGISDFPFFSPFFPFFKKIFSFFIFSFCETKSRWPPGGFADAFGKEALGQGSGMACAVPS